ncbi:hypothetical protein J437_LFUL013936 [Ladona fulva]|uniref:Uncharacterized protein n=1 Tax=Ladona fulva TaxID=123851 RepID=A0A8K0KKA7_LADFU|nr:hypothetical protein J437_LFUL013936 [Ladona fulva]
MNQIIRTLFLWRPPPNTDEMLRNLKDDFLNHTNSLKRTFLLFQALLLVGLFAASDAYLGHGGLLPPTKCDFANFGDFSAAHGLSSFAPAIAAPLKVASAQINAAHGFSSFAAPTASYLAGNSYAAPSFAQLKVPAPALSSAAPLYSSYSAAPALKVHSACRRHLRLCTCNFIIRRCSGTAYGVSPSFATSAFNSYVAAPAVKVASPAIASYGSALTSYGSAAPGVSSYGYAPSVKIATPAVASYALSAAPALKVAAPSTLSVGAYAAPPYNYAAAAPAVATYVAAPSIKYAASPAVSTYQTGAVKTGGALIAKQIEHYVSDVT